MANINTTATMKKTSAMLSGKCKKTQEESEKANGRRGLRGRRGGEGERCRWHRAAGTTWFLPGLNGVSFYFMRGTVCEMPTAVVEILKNCGEM